MRAQKRMVWVDSRGQQLTLLSIASNFKWLSPSFFPNFKDFVVKCLT